MKGLGRPTAGVEGNRHVQKGPIVRAAGQIRGRERERGEMAMMEGGWCRKDGGGSVAGRRQGRWRRNGPMFRALAWDSGD